MTFHVYPQFTVASYFTVLSVAIPYSTQWQDDGRSGRSCGLTEVLSQCSPAGTQKNHKKLIRTDSILCVIGTKHLPNSSKRPLPLGQPTTQCYQNLIICVVSYGIKESHTHTQRNSLALTKNLVYATLTWCHKWQNDCAWRHLCFI